MENLEQMYLNQPSSLQRHERRSYSRSFPFPSSSSSSSFLVLNELTGTIPTEWTNFQYLAYLYLYGNNLVGQIPSQLVNLQSLAGL